MSPRRRHPPVPAPGQFRPGAIEVRLICNAGDLPAALARLAELGEAWQPDGTRRSRNPGRVIADGILIVAVPRGQA